MFLNITNWTDISSQMLYVLLELHLMLHNANCKPQILNYKVLWYFHCITDFKTNLQTTCNGCATWAILYYWILMQSVMSDVDIIIGFAKSFSSRTLNGTSKEHYFVWIRKESRHSKVVLDLIVYKYCVQECTNKRKLTLAAFISPK